MSRYLVTANVNIDACACREYIPGDHVATVGYFDIDADTPAAAAEVMFEIGNVPGQIDADGRTWSPGHRSLSKGDVLYVAGEASGDVTVVACAGVGWTTIDLPSNACQA